MLPRTKNKSVCSDKFSKLAVVVVTMNPDLKILNKLVDRIPSSSTLIIVDNNSREQINIDQFKLDVKHRILIENELNKGLATAINLGCDRARVNGSETVLLLDQDTEPEKNSINILLQSYYYLMESGVQLGCIGPKLVDVTTGLDLGFHRIKGLFWKRIFSDANNAPIEISSLNGSGTLMSLDHFFKLGGLDDALFIDHVDTEWSFRVKNSGYALYGIPRAIFLHRMGDKSLRFWFFGWKVWPWRSPSRHRYLFRNAVVLMRRSYTPSVWTFWALLKLVLTFFVHLTVDPQRREQTKNMILGIRDGFAIN